MLEQGHLRDQKAPVRRIAPRLVCLEGLQAQGLLEKMLAGQRAIPS